MASNRPHADSVKYCILYWPDLSAQHTSCTLLAQEAAPVTHAL